MLASRLDKELEERLTAAAKKSGRTKTALARKAIEEYIDELEDIALLEAALADYDPSQNIPIEEVIRRLGLEDCVFKARRQAVRRSRQGGSAKNRQNIAPDRRSGCSPPTRPRTRRRLCRSLALSHRPLPGCRKDRG